MPKPRFRFVHAADLHIDSRFVAWSGAPAAVRSALMDSTFRAFRNLVQLCIARDADFLLVAGDVYDSSDRSVRAQLRFRDGLAELAEHGISSFVVHGNHDPLDGWANTIKFPPQVTIFGAEPRWATATSGGQPVARIQGVSYPTQEVRDNLAARIGVPEESGLFTIGLLHCNLGLNPNHPNYAPCSIGDLERAGIDYWALGHIHKREIVRPAGPTVVYPGNIQARDIGEAGPRGCYVVDVDDSGRTALQFAPLDVVRWEQAEVAIDDVESLDDLIRAVRVRLTGLRDGSEGRSLVCRLSLIGRGPVHEELTRDDSLDDLTAHLRDDFMPDEPWVWLDRLEDRTLPDLNVESRAREQDFLGLLLSRVSAELGDGPRLSEIAQNLNSELKASRDRDVAVQLTEDDVRRLLDRARWLLAERLDSSAH
ncbi:MAG: DNA repair exonuclease [Chloroflexi bacterium]|nr:DNA repair exonuclease [Chloroflexota bacterium]